MNIKNRTIDLIMASKVLDRSPGLSYITNLENNQFKFIFVSTNVHSLLGFHSHEFIGDSDLWMQQIHSEDLNKLMSHQLKPTEQLNQINNYRFMDSNGDYHWLKDEFNVLHDDSGQPVSCIGSWKIISNSEYKSECIIKNEERFSLALSGANDGIWDWDLRTNEVYLSPRWKSMLGYEDNEIRNHLDEWSNNVHPEDLSTALASIESYINGSSEEYRVEFRMRHKNSHYVDILARGFAVRNEQNKAIRLIGTHVDISEQKYTELLLRESEHKFRTMFDSSKDAIMLLDETGFFDCNKATLDMFVCNSREEFCTKHPVDLSPKFQEDGSDSVASAKLHIAKVMQEGSNCFEWLHSRMNGEIFSAEVLLSTMEIEGKVVIGATVRDISARKEAERQLKEGIETLQKTNIELKEAQAQLLQSEKMASIGQLAAGVAHEINNPVGYVNSNIVSLNGYIEEIFQLLSAYENIEPQIQDCTKKQELMLLKEKVDLNFLKQDINNIVSESIEGVTRVKDIVQDLKEFSHVDKGEWFEVDLHKGINSTLNIVNNELKYKAEIIKEFADIPQVYCIPSQLNQVIMNLLVNAGHAIEEKGKIWIRTGLEGDDKIWIEVEDTGTGISNENIARIFEPFFTTKDIGKGTGLGLSMAYGIIKKHKGSLDVKSEIGKGTVFKLSLPIYKDD